VQTTLNGTDVGLPATRMAPSVIPVRVRGTLSLFPVGVDHGGVYVDKTEIVSALEGRVKKPNLSGCLCMICDAEAMIVIQTKLLDGREELGRRYFCADHYGSLSVHIYKMVAYELAEK